MATLRVGIDASKARQGASEFNSAVKSMEASAGFLEKALLAIGIKELGSSIVGSIASYEGLKSALITATHSASGAEAAFSKLKDFADQTPYTLEQATKAYIRMASAGLRPSIEALTDFGDIASAIPGKSILDFVEAVADGTQGQDKRLKEFGINLEKHGKTVAIAFGNMRQVVNNDAKSIEEGIRKVAQANFGGSMERASHTLAGQWSTLQDKAAGLAAAVGEGGLLDALKDSVVEFTALTASSESTAHQFGYILGEAVSGVSSVLQLFLSHIEEVKTGFVALALYLASTAVPGLIAAGESFLFISANIAVAITAAGGFRAAMLATMAANPFGWVVLGVTAFVELAQHWESISSAISSWIPPSWTQAVQDFRGAGESHGQQFEDFGKEAQADVKAFGESAVSYGQEIADTYLDVKEKVEISKEEQAAFNDMVFTGAGLVDQYARAWGVWGPQVEETHISMNDLADAAKRLDKSLAGGVFTRTIDAVTSPTFEKNFKDTIREKEAADKKAASDAKQRAEEFKRWQDNLQRSANENWWQYQHDKYEKEKQLVIDLEEFKRRVAESHQNYLMDKLQQDANAYLLDPDAQKRAKDTLAFNENQNKEREEAEKRANYKSPIEKWAEDYANATTAAEKFNEVALSGVNQISSAFATALTGGKVDWADFYKSMEKEVIELIIKMLIATAIKAALGGATAGLSNSFSSGFGIAATAFHEGGVVGSSGSPRAADPSWFSAAPRFHSGTVPGLRPDEVPAILQKGEHVFTEAQMRSGGGGKTVNIHNYFPDVKDGRGFGRSIGQNSGRLRRQIQDTDND